MKSVIIISSILFLSNLTTRNLITKRGDVWMSSNLSVSTFRNGDTIFHARTNEEWRKAHKNKTPAFCYLNNDSIGNKNLGELYNFYAVNDKRGLAPEGWHVATDEEWEELINEFGGYDKAGMILRNNNFNFEPGGFRDFDGQFINAASGSLFWTATIDFNFLSYNRQIPALDKSSITKGSSHHAMGLYVRCVENNK
jgi:uncharacterized protein (TIGR02145 family)